MPSDALDPIETTVLSYMLTDRFARDYALEHLTVDAFPDLYTSQVFTAIARRHRDGRPVTVDLIVAEDSIAAHELKAATRRSAGLTDITAIDQLRERRWRVQVAARADEIAAAARDLGTPVAKLRDLRLDDMLAGAPTVLPAPLEPLDALAEQYAGTDYDWVVPKVLERGDRLIVVARDGSGKSMWLTQWAYQIAAGVNPCRPTLRQDPAKVMLVDAENSDRQTARRLPRFLYCANRSTDNAYDPTLIVRVADLSMNLFAPYWRDRIEGHLEVERPAVLILGPLYKLFAHDSRMSYEENALAAARLIDGWRARYSVTVILEAHSSKGGGLGTGGDELLDVRGSGVWRGWPEFGRFLALDPERQAWRWGQFRGDRDHRDWPQWWYRNEAGNGWPWLPAHSEEPPSITSREWAVQLPSAHYARSFDSPEEGDPNDVF